MENRPGNRSSHGLRTRSPAIRNFSEPRLIYGTGLFLLLIWQAAFCSLRSPHEWEIIQHADTLDLFIKDRLGGSAMQSFIVDGKNGAILVETRLQAGDADTASLSMEADDRRRYGLDGRLTGADMELAGREGTTRWHIGKDIAGGWTLAVTAGGVTRERHLSSVNESLEQTYRFYRDMKNRAIQPGEVFTDTSFDLESGTSVFQQRRCLEAPSRQNGFCWIFLSVNSAIGHEDTLKIDTSGAEMYEGMYPFVGRRKNGSGRKASISAFDELAIPAEQPAGPDQSIALVLETGLSPDSSVMQWYRHQGNAWIVTAIREHCPNAASAEESTAEPNQYTAATVTMQSDDARIVRLADSLVKGRADRCDSIGACFRWVYDRLEKRITPTFSNAIETLEAGYGDCNQHAVLLGALLRAVKIPARIILGMVYSPGKKGYYGHAWVAAWSRNGWVFVDPALGVFPAGQDRIPLVIDDTGSEGFRIARLMGRIKVQVAGPNPGK